jgi:hypothetical protein
MSYHSFSVMYIRIRSFWGRAWRELFKIHRRFGCLVGPIIWVPVFCLLKGDVSTCGRNRTQFIWLRIGTSCTIHALAWRVWGKPRISVRAVGIPVAIQTGHLPNTSTGFKRFWDRYLWSSLWFLFNDSANSGLEPQISSWPLSSTAFYNSLFIRRTTIPTSLNQTNTGTLYRVEKRAISFLRKVYRGQYQYWHSALGAIC